MRRRHEEAEFFPSSGRLQIRERGMTDLLGPVLSGPAEGEESEGHCI